MRGGSTGKKRSILTLGLILGLAAIPALAQLRVGEWNVTNYASGRVTEFGTALYGTYQGRSFAPDVLIAQEFLSAAAITNYLNILNTAPGSPGDWAAAPFEDGTQGGEDSYNGFFYRTSKAVFLGVTTVIEGGLSPQPPRDVQRYDIRLVGVTPETNIACYSSHMKAAQTTDDQQRRTVEAQAIAQNARSLSSGWHFILGG